MPFSTPPPKVQSPTALMVILTGAGLACVTDAGRFGGEMDADADTLTGGAGDAAGSLGLSRHPSTRTQAATRVERRAK